MHAVLGWVCRVSMSLPQPFLFEVAWGVAPIRTGWKGTWEHVRKDELLFERRSEGHSVTGYCPVPIQIWRVNANQACFHKCLAPLAEIEQSWQAEP